jgi:hypothetical protein
MDIFRLCLKTVSIKKPGIMNKDGKTIITFNIGDININEEIK